MEIRTQTRTGTQETLETVALKEGEGTHGEKDTTHLSSEQDACTRPQVNDPGGKARGLARDFA